MREILGAIKKKKYPLIIFFAVTLIFLLIYNKMLFCGYSKMFKDIGVDSVFLGYPNTYIRGLVQSKQLSSGYILRQGLGEFMQPSWSTLLDPLNWIYLFVGVKYITVAKMLVLYMEYIIIACFAYLFLRKLLKNEFSCVIGTLLWSFSGYMVLWEQHDFSVALVYFTAAMYFLQCYLEDRKQGAFLVIPFCCLALYSYYFFYMAGLFSALYVVGYCIIKKKKVLDCVKKMLCLAAAGAFAGGIAAVRIVPALREFLVSARTDVSEQAVQGLFYTPDYLISCVGRLLSNDMFGTGNDFTGYYNYYEAAVLAVSALVIPAIVILLKTKYKRIVVTLSLLCIVLMTIPTATYIFTFDARKPRWTFMPVFLIVIMIGFMIDSLWEHIVTVNIKDIIIIVGIYLLLFLVLFWADRRGIADVKRQPAVYVAVFVVLYCVILMIFTNKNYSGLMLAVVVLELITLNYSALNKRDIILKEEFEQGYYNDGTSEVLKYVSDDSIYRVNKTYDSVFYNDAKVQGYNGLAVYDPTNTKWLIEYYKTMGFELINGKIHYVRIPTDRSILNTLLGVKYIVARDGDAVPENYQEVYSLNGKILYLNRQALGFGYIYGSRMNKETFEQLSNDEKDIVLTQYYFLTDEDGGDKISVEGINVQDNLVKLSENSAYNTTQDKNTIKFSIFNSYEKDAMLCIPIIYDSNWKAYVNGDEVSCINVNGGLLGVDMSDYGIGEHEIKIVYETYVYKAGAIISIIMTIIYIMWLVMYFKKRNCIYHKVGIRL